ncbi:hypothetical protein [Fulvivirga sediminis]|uniref:Uncharacterized protein n=1 Tax=Fulvivirga sediminis TaxID=2803949 RepID=A0A937K1S5_9BACT|nr:hypothetical protein [Fulvivirga sediminis]MBL3658884.1 hypothetical protein [Fulvivirga sediminis]
MKKSFLSLAAIFIIFFLGKPESVVADVSLNINEIVRADTLGSHVNKEFTRNEGEGLEVFVNRVAYELYGEEVSRNHPAIETTHWVADVSTIILFFNTIIDDDDAVEGFILFSKDEIKYNLIRIDNYLPAGNGAEIASVFFANADSDPDKELIVLCTWPQRIKLTAEGTLYQTYIYDDLNSSVYQDKLIYLADISGHFGLEFEGWQEGDNVKARYKNASAIRAELKRLGY